MWGDTFLPLKSNRINGFLHSEMNQKGGANCFFSEVVRDLECKSALLPRRGTASPPIDQERRSMCGLYVRTLLTWDLHSSAYPIWHKSGCYHSSKKEADQHTQMDIGIDSLGESFPFQAGGLRPICTWQMLFSKVIRGSTWRNLNCSWYSLNQPSGV